jgi:hypothetical protein
MLYEPAPANMAITKPKTNRVRTLRLKGTNVLLKEKLYETIISYVGGSRIATEQTAIDVHIYLKNTRPGIQRSSLGFMTTKKTGCYLIPLCQQVQTEYQDFEYRQVSPYHQPSLVCHPIPEIP